MGSQVHKVRRELRVAVRDGRGVVGTFVKLPVPDIVEVCASTGFDFFVVDLEHSTLSEQDAIALVRHADTCGLAALVRVPAVEPAVINRLLENGAAGIQLSMLQTCEQARALRDAARYPPVGRRSASLMNRIADGSGLGAHLGRESDDPPLLVGQIETAHTERLDQLLIGLDVCFIGSTDLAVDLGVESGDPRLREVIDAVIDAVAGCGAAFGGWAPSFAGAAELGLRGGYLVIGSDLQILATGLRAAVPPRK